MLNGLCAISCSSEDWLVLHYRLRYLSITLRILFLLQCGELLACHHVQTTLLALGKGGKKKERKKKKQTVLPDGVTLFLLAFTVV